MALSRFTVTMAGALLVYPSFTVTFSVRLVVDSKSRAAPLLTVIAPVVALIAKYAAPVPPVKYESPFAGYVPYREKDVAPWRDVNDEVARAGGHAGIFGGHGARMPDKPGAKPAPLAGSGPGG